MITNDVNLHQNCDKIEAMVRHCEPGDVVKLSPPDSQGLVTLMNAGGKWRGHIERMYWGVSPAVLEGVVNQVRTALINLVAEITAHMPEGVDTPSPEVATNANFLVTGERHKISFSAPQAGTALAAPLT